MVLLIVVAGAYVYSVYKTRSVCRIAFENGEQYAFTPGNCTEVCKAHKLNSGYYINVSSVSLLNQTNP